MSGHQERIGVAGPDSSPIPRHFHFIWFGGDPPQEFTEYMFGWLDQHPGWGVRVWDEDNLFPLYNQHIFDFAEAIAGSRAGQLRADIARYEILYRQGGVYVDFDFECKKSIAGLIDNDLPSQQKEPIEFFAAWEEQDRWVNNALMGAVPGHKFLKDLIEDLSINVERNRGTGPNVMTGPQYLTHLYLTSWHTDPGVVIFPQENFYPYLWNELHREGEEFPQAYAVHHWNHKRGQRVRD